ncbi:MAG: NAD(P)/FAD-dependent oxidoreductase [Flavobacteriaceae bacterium]|nr:NAD(P)/FAD-dependent oxidoreductase [Flavobacteriaceae bacterium]
MPQLPLFIPESNLPRLVIIGSGFAGLQLAKKLKKAKYQIVVLDKNNFHQFQPLLYQVATSGLEPDSIVFPTRKIVRDYKNTFFRMVSVQKIQPQEKCILTDKGSLSYDYLVIATGSVNNFYGMQDVSENAVGLKSIHEALAIRSMILQHLETAVDVSLPEEKEANTTVVIVGAGPAGVEMAGALAEFKKYVFPKDYAELKDYPLQIHLISSSIKTLPMLSEKSSKNSLKDLKRLKVNVHLGVSVQAYDGLNVKLSNGETITATNLIWTAGVKGAFPKGLQPDVVQRGNRIEVDTFNCVKGCENIFAIGDVGMMKTNEFPNGHPMVAPVAMQQGKNLATNFKLPKENWNPFKYYDKGSLATIGKKSAVADFGKLHISGIIAWFIWSTVHLMSISGFKNKIAVGLNWASSYFTYDKGNRLIIRKYKHKKAFDCITTEELV